jgi:hypothetical protein
VLAAVTWAWLDVRSGLRQGKSFRELVSPRGTPPAEGVQKLLSFAPKEVRAIRLRRGSSILQTTRTDGGWTGTTRPDLLDDFLHDLLDLGVIMRFDVAPSGLTSHGLAPPRGEIELIRGDGPPIDLRLGDSNPPATGLYVQVGRGGRVVLTGALIQWEFEKAVNALTEDAAAIETPSPGDR